MTLRQLLTTAVLLIVGCHDQNDRGGAAEPIVDTVDSTYLTAAIDAIVEAAESDGFAGQVAVDRSGHEVFPASAGHADGASTVPVDEATRFQVASVTKFLTAVLVLRAAEEELIALDEKLGTYLPESKAPLADATIDQLLSHRSGLGSSYVAERIGDREEALRAILEQPVDETAIGGFRYSNDAYDLLAILLERLHGRPFEEIARAGVLEPAGMTATRFWSEVDTSDPRLVGQPLEPISDELGGRNYGMLGSQGLLTTARELVALRHALDGGRLLDEDSLRELSEPRSEVSIGSAAYGSFLLDDTPLGTAHVALGAESWGDNAILAHYPACRLAVAVVTSRGPDTEDSSQLFRARISGEIATAFAPVCAAETNP